MKYLMTTLFLFFLNSDKKADYDYNLLIGSWSQKSFANTTSTGIFTFKKDSIADLEMRDGKTNTMIAGMHGPYKIEKANKIIKINMMGKEKTFEIHELSTERLIIQNKKEGKEKQVFERYTEKE